MKTETEEKTDIIEIFSSKKFESLIKKYKTELDLTHSQHDISKLIHTVFITFCNDYIDIGTQEHRKIDDKQVPNLHEPYLLHYVLPESFKDSMLLHRDVLLQLQIAKNKNQEGIVSHMALDTHLQQSIVILKNATDALLTIFSSERKAIYESGKESKKLFDKIKHYKNPWNIYRDQFLNIKKQIKEIENTENIFTELIDIFNDIKEYTTTIYSNSLNEAGELKKHMLSIRKKLQSIEEIDQVSDFIIWLDKLISETDHLDNNLDEYTVTLEAKIKMLKEHTIPVATDDGLLLTKKNDFTKTAKKWLDYELLPLLIDLWDHKASITSYFKHSLLNLKSSLVLAKNNNSLDIMPSQLGTLKSIYQTIIDNAEKQDETASQIKEKITQDFLVSKIYNGDEFLEVSLQSSLNQFTSGKNGFVKAFQHTLKKLFSNFTNTYEKSIATYAHKNIETSAICINYRMFKESNALYDTMFLNKNFIGNLFILPRLEEEKRLSLTIDQWKGGFKKAVLILGSGLSGKTTFMEYTAKKYFGKQSIFLETDSTIALEGRKFKTTKNLKEALLHIKKNVYQTKPIIILDNLELWRDSTYSLLDNVRALIAFIESESDNAFIMVSTSPAMEKHLNKRVQFSNTYSTIIDISKAKIEEIHKAILLRHGASHKTLVTPQEIPLTNKQIEQTVVNLSKKMGYTIGEVLQTWTYSTTIIEGNKVIYEEKEYTFEDFFTKEEIIILKYVSVYKYINEMQLKQFLGTQYYINFKSGLKRLINTKVLLRDSTGVLKLNQIIGYDINQILKYRGTLN